MLCQWWWLKWQKHIFLRVSTWGQSPAVLFARSVKRRHGEGKQRNWRQKDSLEAMRNTFLGGKEAT